MADAAVKTHNVIQNWIFKVKRTYSQQHKQFALHRLAKPLKKQQFIKCLQASPVHPVLERKSNGPDKTYEEELDFNDWLSKAVNHNRIWANCSQTTSVRLNLVVDSLSLRKR